MAEPLDVPRETYYGLLDRDFQKQQNDTGTLRIEHDFSPALKLRNQTRLSRTEQDFIWTQPDSNLGNTYYNLLWRRANTRVGTVDTVANQTDLSGSFRTGAIGHKYGAGVEVLRGEGQLGHLQGRYRRPPLREGRRGGQRLQLHDRVRSGPGRSVGRRDPAQPPADRCPDAHALGPFIRLSRDHAAVAASTPACGSIAMTPR